MAEWYEVKAKYCDNCKNKDHCHTPCPLVNAALFDLPCEKEIYDICTKAKKEEREIQNNEQKRNNKIFR